MEEHSITPDALPALLASNEEVLLFEVRQPLDLLADPEIIVGAKRIPPKYLLENPTLFPGEKHLVVYSTCPSDKTSRVISQQAQAMAIARKLHDASFLEIMGFAAGSTTSVFVKANE
jgi:hypothetical protein